MKKLQKSLFLGLIAVGTYVVAGSVTIPNSFSANTPAKASEVNANFSAVKTAVDGNEADIATNKTGVATNKADIETNANDVATNAGDIATNATAIGQKVSNVIAGGGVEVSQAGGDTTVKLKSGYVAVHGSAFGTYEENGENCNLTRYWQEGAMGLYFSNSSTLNTCSAFANVQIPYGAIVKKLICRVKHNHAGDLSVRLVKQNRSYVLMGGYGNIQRTTLTEATLDAGAASGATQVIGDDVSGGVLFINSSYVSYFIEWDPPATSSASTSEMLYDCKVDYEYR